MSESSSRSAGWSQRERLKLLGKVQTERWEAEAHEGQLPPPGDWRILYVQGARGSGKTKTGAEIFAGWILNNPPGEWGMVAPYQKDARNVMMEHPKSGLLQALGPAKARWNRSTGELWVHGGSRVFTEGTDEFAKGLQGHEFRGLWGDEIGLWENWEQVWKESIRFTVRDDPGKILLTGTPKGKKGLVKHLLEQPKGVVAFTFPKLDDNIENLSPEVVADLHRDFDGSRIGRQELYGEILDDVEGALWHWDMIEDHRIKDPEQVPEMVRSVVAVDPAVTAKADSDETGIVVASLGTDGDAYVEADLSGKFSPKQWAKLAIDAYYDRGLDRIIYERNQGGDMVTDTFRNADPNVPLRAVWAAKGKVARAEPIAALYESGRVHHVGSLPELEDEMTTWEQGKASPSRLDAAVWALSHLFQRETVVIVGADAGKGLTGDLFGMQW